VGTVHFEKATLHLHQLTLQTQPSTYFPNPLIAAGNGFPISGVVTTPRLASLFANGMEYFNTYGGNNAAVAAGKAVLMEMRELNLQQHAADVGRCASCWPTAACPAWELLCLLDTHAPAMQQQQQQQQQA
jgi:hypothetical protein